MKKHRVGILVFDGVTQLDFTAPHEVLASHHQMEVVLLATRPGPVTSDRGLVFQPSHLLQDTGDLCVLLVPGGPGINAVMQDGVVLDFLQEQAKRVQYLTSVCTGALALGAAGLLRGRKATTHWASLDVLTEMEAIPVKERWVVDRSQTPTLITGGGVTAGLDFALALIAEVFSEEDAMRIQLGMEYQPHPPFSAGSPQQASHSMVARHLEFMKPILEERKRLAQQARRHLRNPSMLPISPQQPHPQDQPQNSFFRLLGTPQGHRRSFDVPDGLTCTLPAPLQAELNGNTLVLFTSTPPIRPLTAHCTVGNHSFTLQVDVIPEQVDATPLVPDARLRACLQKEGDFHLGHLRATTTLDAAFQGISSLQGLEHCTRLRDLNLQGNPIRSLAALGGLNRLRSLNLSRVALRSLQGLPDLLPELQHLDLSGNLLASLKHFPQHLPALTTLNLAENHLHGALLEDLPPSLPALRVLNLNHNAILRVRDLPRHLPNLRALMLDHNPMLQLQGFRWEKLETLSLRHSGPLDLKGLPASLPELRTLDLTSCFVENWEGFPADLPRLEVLGLEGASFEDPARLEGCQHNLRVLRLSSNSLHSLQGMPGMFPVLETLLLAHTQLESLEGFPQAPALTLLDLEGCPLQSLRSLPEALPQLEVLNLAENQLASLQGLPEHLPCLRKLRLGGNPLQDLAGLPADLPGLEHLELFRLDLSTLCGLPDTLPRLKHLEVSAMGLHTLGGLPSQLPALQFLRLEHLELVSLQGLPRQLDDLQELRLSMNGLTSLQGLPEKLPALKVLNVGGNHLQSLYGLPPHLPTLRALNLSDNPLQKVNVSSLAGKPLESLDVSGLDLTSLEGVLGDVRELKVLHAVDNPLTSLRGLEEATRLTHLWVFRCKLVDFTGLPTHLPHLRLLWAANNPLQSLNGLPRTLPSLEDLDLQGCGPWEAHTADRLSFARDG